MLSITCAFLLKLAISYFDLESLQFRDNLVLSQFTEEITIYVNLLLQFVLFAIKQTLERVARHILNR